MSRAATSMLVFGVYLIVLGSVLILAPNVLLGIFGIAPTNEVWIRILGVVVLALGLYDCAAARQEVIPYFRWTVWGRALVVVSLISFVALTLAPPVLLVFGVIDGLGATWTWAALRRTRSTTISS